MTVITVRHPEGTIGTDQRRTLARTLTDAVALIECGQITETARWGFQVHFLPLPADSIAIGGTLASDLDGLAPIVVDIAVMDGHWPPGDRRAVIEGTLSALADALGADAPPPTWWVTFRVIDEGCWGANGTSLSMLDLLGTGAFTPERAEAIKTSLGP